MCQKAVGDGAPFTMEAFAHLTVGPILRVAFGQNDPPIGVRASQWPLLTTGGPSGRPVLLTALAAFACPLAFTNFVTFSFSISAVILIGSGLWLVAIGHVHWSGFNVMEDDIRVALLVG